MEIYLFNFQKRVNSTLRPNLNTGTRFEGYMRNSDPFSVYNPSIQFSLSQTSFTKYNYAYISDFADRYYWITDWVYEEGHWIATMEVDVLATYKSQIGNKSMYILRSSAIYNPRIEDSKYPTKMQKVTQTVESSSTLVWTPRRPTLGYADSTFWGKPMTEGSYILAIYGGAGNGITYYSMSPAGFQEFATQLSSWDISGEDGWQFSDLGNIPKQYAKTIADPLQFIQGCFWIPISQDLLIRQDATPIGSVKLGYYSTSFGSTAFPLDVTTDMIRCTTTWAIPKHPQSSSRGVWLQNDKYSSYMISLYPFGDITINASDLIDYDTILAEWYIDIITLDSLCFIYAVDYTSDVNNRKQDLLLATSEATFGVPVLINQVTSDIRGLVSNTVTAAKKTMGGYADGIIKGSARGGVVGSFVGGIAGGIAGLAKGAAESVGNILDAVEAAQPTISSTGAPGTYLPFGMNIKPRLFAQFVMLADEWNSELGRPLCEVHTPNQIPGYIQTEPTDFSAIGTAEESNTIAQFMVGGFYYE